MQKHVSDNFKNGLDVLYTFEGVEYKGVIEKFITREFRKNFDYVIEEEYVLVLNHSDEESNTYQIYITNKNILYFGITPIYYTLDDFKDGMKVEIDGYYTSEIYSKRNGHNYKYCLYVNGNELTDDYLFKHSIKPYTEKPKIKHNVIT